MTTVVLYPKGLTPGKVAEALILGGEFQPTAYEFIEDTTGTINAILMWDPKDYPTCPSGLQMSVDFSSWDTENKTLLLNRVEEFFDGLTDQ